MTIEALSSNEFLNFIIYDTISATPLSSQENLETPSFPVETNDSNKGNNAMRLPQDEVRALNSSSLLSLGRGRVRQLEAVDWKQNLAAQGRRKRRRKPRFCKNKEEAETQRMTHIAVERNRRKLMNEHLAVLRSLMPESYVQRGDQASIVGGAIQFLKELEHLLQTLETQKLQLLQNGVIRENNEEGNSSEILPPPFAQLFVYPQYTRSQFPNNKFTSKTKAVVADIEVTLIETHANLRILSRRSPRQLSKLVAGFESLLLSILHLNVTKMDQMVLYSISAKVEEGCQLITVDDIAGAVHHMLRIIEEAAANVDGIGVRSCP